MAACVFIAYGFAEGPRHGARLRRTLTARGFMVTTDISQANIIVAHSGAAHILPVELSDKVVVLVAPSCGSSRPNIIKTSLQKALKDMRLTISAQSQKGPMHLAWNIYYLVRDARHNRALQQATFRAKCSLPVFQAKTVMVIAYNNDPWRPYTPVHGANCYVSLPGSHDSIWYQCEDFANTVQLLYEQLLA